MLSRFPRSQPLGKNVPAVSPQQEGAGFSQTGLCAWMLHVVLASYILCVSFLPVVCFSLFVKSLIISTATLILWSPRTAQLLPVAIQKKMDHRTHFPLHHGHVTNKISSTSQSQSTPEGSSAYVKSPFFTVVGRSSLGSMSCHYSSPAISSMLQILDCSYAGMTHDDKGKSEF